MSSIGQEDEINSGIVILTKPDRLCTFWHFKIFYKPPISINYFYLNAARIILQDVQMKTMVAGIHLVLTFRSINAGSLLLRAPERALLSVGQMLLACLATKTQMPFSLFHIFVYLLCTV